MELAERDVKVVVLVVEVIVVVLEVVVATLTLPSALGEREGEADSEDEGGISVTL